MTSGITYPGDDTTPGGDTFPGWSPSDASATGLTFFPVTGDFQAVDDVSISSNSSAPSVDVVSGLVTFTPRLPQGFQALISNFQVSQDTNNRQTITLVGNIDGGTYTLAFQSVWLSNPLAPGATAEDVQIALEGLSTIGTGNVEVSGDAGGPYTVEFIGLLGNQMLSQLNVDDTLLDSSTSNSVAVRIVMLQPGSISRVASTAVSLPVRTGRIWTSGRLCSVNVFDTPNVDLVANTPALGLGFDLIYDVTYSAVMYNGDSQSIAPFAFVAPTDTTPVCITDPTIDRLPYVQPLTDVWNPGWTPSDYSEGVVSASVVPIWAAHGNSRNWRQAG